VLKRSVVVFQQLHSTSVDDWMIFGKKVSKPELTVEAVTTESDLSVAAESAAKLFNFEVH